MSTGTITSKGQITIPKDVRDELLLEPGSRVNFVKNEDGFFELHREKRPVSDLAGSLRFNGSARTLDEMDAAIAAAAAEAMRRLASTPMSSSATSPRTIPTKDHWPR